MNDQISSAQPSFDPSMKQKAALQQAVAQVAPQKPTGQFDYQQAISAGYSPTQIKNFLDQNTGIDPINAPDKWDEGLMQNAILPQPVEVTQQFGTYNPNLEVFSGGHALDTNFAADKGTPVALPPGKWKVLSTYTGAQDGQPGDGANSGYGNAIMAQDEQGNKLHFIHLSDVHVSPGDQLKGGLVVGKVGDTGNATGSTLGVEYYNPQGQLGEVLNSPYASYFPVKGVNQ